MTRSTVFMISFLVAVVATLSDYLIGRLINSPSLGIFCWAGLVMLVSAVLDTYREWRREHAHNSGGGYTVSLDLTNVLRGADIFRWGTIISSIAAAAFAAVGAYIFILATFTLRYTAVSNGPKLGKLSPYDHSAVTRIVGFQTSSVVLWFIVACFFLALLLRPPALLPLGVMGVSLANAANAPLAPLTRSIDGPSSQLAQTLSQPDAWFLKALPADLFWACLAALVVGIAVCWCINGILAFNEILAPAK